MMARKKEGLSERHIKILEVLENYQENVGYPPSIREIGREANISSTSVVNYYLDQLEKKGYIEPSYQHSFMIDSCAGCGGCEPCFLVNLIQILRNQAGVCPGNLSVICAIITRTYVLCQPWGAVVSGGRRVAM